MPAVVVALVGTFDSWKIVGRCFVVIRNRDVSFPKQNALPCLLWHLFGHSESADPRLETIPPAQTFSDAFYDEGPSLLDPNSTVTDESPPLREKIKAHRRVFLFQFVLVTPMFMDRGVCFVRGEWRYISRG